jgi:hypothetical protein
MKPNCLRTLCDTIFARELLHGGVPVVDATPPDRHGCFDVSFIAPCMENGATFRARTIQLNLGCPQQAAQIRARLLGEVSP